MKKLDAILRLFDGDITLSELVRMDMPSQRVIVEARIANLKDSQDRFEKGFVDSYSRRYASVMGGFSSLSDSPSPKKQPEQSKNFRANMLAQRADGENE
jgi:hypothetical protein